MTNASECLAETVADYILNGEMQRYCQEGDLEDIEGRIGMIEERTFYEYAVYDEDGFLDGLREDSPEEVKADYEVYLKEQEEAKNKGIKL